MKIKIEYLNHVYDSGFDIGEFLVEEEGDIEMMQKFLISDQEYDFLKLVKNVINKLEPNWKVHRTKFARDQYKSLMHRRLREYCPLMSEIVSVTMVQREKYEKYMRSNRKKFAVSEEFCLNPGRPKRFSRRGSNSVQ
jgi:hypothetical protein